MMSGSSSNTNLTAALFSKSRHAILSLLYGNADKAYYLREIVRTTGVGLGAAQRELGKLTAAGAIRRTVLGKHVYYRANAEYPEFKELQSLMARSREKGTIAEPTAPYSGAAPPGGTTLRMPLPRRKLAAFCRRHGIRKLSLFGSVLRDDFRPESDVDVLVEFEPGSKPGYFKLYDMEMELSKLFGGRKVDLRTAGELSRYFRQRVINAARVEYDAAG